MTIKKKIPFIQKYKLRLISDLNEIIDDLNDDHFYGLNTLIESIKFRTDKWLLFEKDYISLENEGKELIHDEGSKEIVKTKFNGIKDIGELLLHHKKYKKVKK